MTSDFNIPIDRKRGGIEYFIFGIKLCFTKGIRRFVVLPLVANLLLFGGMLIYLFMNITSWVQSSVSLLPDWLSWLDYILIPLAIIIILGGFGYFFGTVANWIAAPFNGLLAEKLEMLLTGEQIDDQSIFYIIKDTPRILKREWKKLIYCLPKALLILLLFFVPVIGQVLAPLIWFLFSGWMLVIQYCDYPFDNHKVPFNDMTTQLREDGMRSYSFGIMVNVCTLIPFVNWFVMPIAVCGATAMWVDCYRSKNLFNNPQTYDAETNTSQDDIKRLSY